MAQYSISAQPSGSSQANAQSRMINSILPYTAGTYKTISYMSRRNGVWCSAGGTSQSVTMEVYAQLLSGETVIKTSNFATCKSYGSGPSSDNYATTEFTDWTSAESGAAITAWEAGTLELKWFVSIKSYTSSGHGSPSFRDGQYDDVITIQGQDVPPTNYAPSITGAKLWRTLDGSDTVTPTAEALRMKLRLGMNDTSGLSAGAALKLYYAQNAAPTVGASEYVDLSAYIQSCLEAETAIAISGTFSAGADWYFTLVFTAGDEVSSPWYGNAPRAQAPIHIGERNNGVAIGGYSPATASDRRFDVFWPGYMHERVHFMGGVSGFGGYSTDETPTGEAWIDGSPIYRKVLEFTSITNGSNNDAAINAGGVIGTIIRFWGLGYNSAGAYAWNIPHYDSSSSYGILAEAVSPTGDNPKIRIKPGSGRGLGTAVVVVEYTLEG